MGYFVEITEIDFFIPKENLDSAYHAMCELNKCDSKKRGMVFGGYNSTEDIENSNSVSKNPNKWFSRMPWNYDELYTSVHDIFSALGFEFLRGTNGIYLAGYNGKSGQEGVFLESVAPYVKAGSYINWRGEDGYLYRYEFDGEKMAVKKGTVTWEDISSHC